MSGSPWQSQGEMRSHPSHLFRARYFCCLCVCCRVRPPRNLFEQHGANPMARDRRNRNAEHWAYKQGHMNMVLVKVVVWWTPPIKKY